MILSRISLALLVAGLFTACTTQPVVKYQYMIPELMDGIYKSCPKPTTLKADMGVSSMKELAVKSNVEVDAKILKAYARTKNDHVSCYQTLYNVKKTLEEQRLAVKGEKTK